MWHCLGLLEAGLSPPAPRDHEKQALWSCCCSSLTSLLHICHLSLVWVLTSHSWGPGSSIRASTPQGPPCHTVTALLRDQDKVLLLAPVFSHGICTGKLCHHPGKHSAAPLAQRGVSSLGHVGWFCCLWQLLPFWSLHSPLQQPSTD